MNASATSAVSRATTTQRRSWYAYDWANSGYVTTVSTVLFNPYITQIAKNSACPNVPPGSACTTDLRVLGLPISPGSLATYAVTLGTLLIAVTLPLLGAWVDRSRHRRELLTGFAWVGAAAVCGMWFVQGTAWQLGVTLLIIANICLAGSLVIYDALLTDIASPQERDLVSSRGWAMGYLAGFLLLLANLWLLNSHDQLGLSLTEAVRFSLLSAGLWWAGFTLVPFIGLRGLTIRPVDIDPTESRGFTSPFRQLGQTLRHMRDYPQTLRFLLAYLVFNDGIQTVIVVSSIYGTEELGFSTANLSLSVLVVQGVAFLGALIFGLLARSFGAKRVIVGALGIWIAVVSFGYVIPRGQFTFWLVLAVVIGLVLGGSQALSRSLYSRLVPAGRSAEYFSFYQAGERGTSWLGTLAFGLVHQLTSSYRPAILALIAFFVIGAVLLWRVNVAAGIADAEAG